MSDVLLYQINPPSVEGFIEFIFVVFDFSKEVCGVVPELFIISGAGIDGLHADIIDEFDDLWEIFKDELELVGCTHTLHAGQGFQLFE